MALLQNPPLPTQRQKLQILLEELLGSRQVYFQPPPNITMKYPAIVYNRDTVRTHHAGNKPYKHMTRYRVTVIDSNPDSVIHEKIAKLPMCTYDRFYAAGNLNHDVYNLFF
jgi:hypothetical protein